MRSQRLIKIDKPKEARESISLRVPRQSGALAKNRAPTIRHPASLVIAYGTQSPSVPRRRVCLLGRATEIVRGRWIVLTACGSRMPCARSSSIEVRWASPAFSAALAALSVAPSRWGSFFNVASKAASASLAIPRSTPATKLASSESRKAIAAATSSGWPYGVLVASATGAETRAITPDQRLGLTISSPLLLG
jgi:hypothetical protein